MEVSASVVLYKNNRSDLERLIRCIFSSLETLKLYLIDNSDTDQLRYIREFNNNISYSFNNANLGFGKAHNKAVNQAFRNGSKFHFVINPDVYFTNEVIPSMIQYIKVNPDIGMLMPKVLNTDGTIQYLPKLLPSPFSIIMRKIKWPAKTYRKFIDKYELRNINSDLIYSAPVLSGCFTLFRTDVFENVCGYDDKFFMYFEDWDISRRIHKKHRTVYFPKVSVVHGYESGANKSFRLLVVFIKSAITYFNKWGWVVDKERRNINTKTLNQVKASL